MKKRLVLGVTAVILIALFVAGGTLAWFTTETAVDNEVTMGNVSIALTEPNFQPTESGSNKITGIYPGAVYEKDPTVENVGDYDCYIRAKVEIIGLESLGIPQEQLLLPLFTINDGWILGEDGYYYYSSKLVKGDKAVLFNEVSIPKEWNNAYQGAAFDVAIKAEAIQADNFEPTRNEAGAIIQWLYSDTNQPIEVEE